MRKRTSLIFLVPFLVLGCGGGGSDSAGVSVNESSADFGPVSTRMSGIPKEPVVAMSGSATITSVFGANFNEVKLNLPEPNPFNAEEALNETSIAFSGNGTTYYLDYGSGKYYPVTGLQRSGNSSHPSFSALGDKFAVTEEVGDSNDWEIFVYNADGSGRQQITSGANWAFTPSMSPDGQWVIYGRGEDIYKVSSTGGAPLLLTSDTKPSTHATWSPDGAKILYFREIDVSQRLLHTMNPDGTDKQPVPGASPHQLTLDACVTADSKQVLFAFILGEETILTRVGSGMPLHVFENFGGFAVAPFGQKAVLCDNGAIIQLDLVTGEKLPLPGPPGVAIDPNWGPYVRTRKLLGSGAPFGTSAGGFAYAMHGSKASSFLSFDSSDRSTINVETVGSEGSENTVLKISGNMLNSLRFVNDFRSAPNVIISSNASTHAKGALVAYDSATGDVASVITFKSTALTTPNPAEIVVEGEFLQAWDEAGVSRRMDGIRRIRIDRRTGRLSGR